MWWLDYHAHISYSKTRYPKTSDEIRMSTSSVMSFTRCTLEGRTSIGYGSYLTFILSSYDFDFRATSTHNYCLENMRHWAYCQQKKNTLIVSHLPVGCSFTRKSTCTETWLICSTSWDIIWDLWCEKKKKDTEWNLHGCITTLRFRTNRQHLR